jgi:hypothetical protein
MGSKPASRPAGSCAGGGGGVGDGGLGCRAMGAGWGLAEVSERRRHASWGFRVLGGGWLRGAEFGLWRRRVFVLALGNGEVSWSANR